MSRTDTDDNSIYHSSSLLPSGLLGQWMYSRGDIWQMKLLNSSGLSSYAKERRLSSARSEHIYALWHVGVLPADLIVASSELEIAGLELAGQSDDGRFWYIDRRPPPSISSVADLLKNAPDPPDEFELQFHPFRCFVLYGIERWTDLLVYSYQPLTYSRGYQRVLNIGLDRLRDERYTRNFAEGVRQNNEIAELAIACEPCAYRTLFGVVKRSVFFDEDEFKRLAEQHTEELQTLVKALGVEKMEEARKRLHRYATLLDDNQFVQNILRLTSGERRLERTRGELGGAMLLRTMAEILRRFTEATFDVRLPEEDDLDHGQRAIEIKKEIYGSERLFDGDLSVSNEYLRQFGLDHGVRLRWYVEGDTELGAIEFAVGDYPAVEVINVAGQVAQARGRGVAFRENLQSDLKSHIFSLVSIDGDRDDYLRAVRKAAQEDEICGGFFVSSPNFEEANYTLDELAKILWEAALEQGVGGDGEDDFIRLASGGGSFKSMLQMIKDQYPLLNQIGKGKEWGERLMRYALSAPYRPGDGGPAPTKRPIIEAVDAAMRARKSNYLTTRRRFRVDANSGRLIDRNSDRA